MLKSIRIQNFKSYKDATLHLSPLSVMIGANASGKSNAIEAIRLLAWIAQGGKLSQIRYTIQESDRAIRGNVQDLGYRGRTSFKLSCGTSDRNWDHFEIRLSLRGEDELHISREKITGPASGSPLYEIVQASSGASADIRVAYNNFVQGGIKPQIVCNDQMAVLTQLQSPARFGKGHKKSQQRIPDITTRYQNWLSGIVFLDPEPAAMRGYSFKTDQTLSESGSNLSGVLSNLCKGSKKNENILLDFVRSLPEQNIDRIGFVRTRRGEAMVTLRETFGKRRKVYDATLLSDGTLRVLSIAAVMLSAKEGSLVVIEEIDNGVHPSRASTLLKGISKIATQRDLRVLISSHNPALLDSLPDEAVPETVFCYRDPMTGSSKLVRLRDIPDYPELIAQGTIGHLMTAGTLDKFVKHHPDLEKKKKERLEWLLSMRKSDMPK